MGDDSTARDPRYADVEEMVAVWDGETIRIVAPREVARRYMDAQWSTEDLVAVPVPVVRSLPKQRPLYILSGRVPYDRTKAVPPMMDDFAEDPGVFPGLGNGKMVPLGEISSSVKEDAPYGWGISVAGWDREPVEAAWASLASEAEAERDAREAAFRHYPVGSVVHDGTHGTLLRGTARGDIPCWRTPAGGVLFDAEVDPEALTLLSGGGDVRP